MAEESKKPENEKPVKTEQPRWIPASKRIDIHKPKTKQQVKHFKGTRQGWQ
jgi:hypothetical protein